MSFGCSISAPPHLALALMDHPTLLPSLPERWPHLVVYYAMTTGGRGSVRNLPVFRDPLVRYRLEGAELAELAEALRRLSRCLLAAGAVALYPCIAGSGVISSEADLGKIPTMLSRDGAGLMTIHTFSTCPMGERRERTAVDSFGRVHDAPGLRIADASLLCDAPGVNPQGSIMAFARRNARHFLDQL
jgi:choline dehydrogenase-like flavoprotein